MTDGSLFIALAVLATFALITGGVYLIAKRRDRTRGILMLIAAVVLLGNVLIVAWPSQTPG